MRVHANAKLGPAGRLALVGLIEGGCSLRTAARESSVSVATAHRWWHRWLSASEQARASRSWLEDRSSRPRRSPRQLSAEQEALILRARARTGLGPARLAGLCRRARSTIWKVLHRHGLSRRRSSSPRQTFRRYEWAQPGALLHMDTKRLERFDTPGHWATGQRSEKIRSRGAGHVYVHCVVDDHSRLAYAECHTADSAQAAAATLERAIAWLGELGCQPPEAVMTDNALIYRRSRVFADTLARHHAHHILTPPWTPRWNGKVERFIQTLDREWAKSQIWPNHQARDRALSSFLRYYNRRRPHSSLGDRPPISRVHNVRGQDS
jgi:transposase InsO family protein